MKRAILALALALSGCSWLSRSTVVTDAHREVAKVAVAESSEVKAEASSEVARTVETARRVRTTRTVTRPDGTREVTEREENTGVKDTTDAKAAAKSEATAARDVKAESEASGQVTTKERGWQWYAAYVALALTFIGAIVLSLRKWFRFL